MYFQIQDFYELKRLNFLRTIGYFC